MSEITAQQRLDTARMELESAAAQVRAEKRRLREENRARTQQAENALKERLAKEHDLLNHPKLDALWRISWSMGHSYGMSEVEFYFNELAELLKP